MKHNLLQRLNAKLGLDKSIAYTSGAQAVSAVGGFVTALFILQCLTNAEQGYYYTFKSVLAIQVFFELGMNTVITQYVAHEASHLRWQGLEVVGPEYHRSRLASLLRFGMRWYTVFSVGLLLVLLVGGSAFFAHYGRTHGDIAWRWPWIILCVTTALNLWLTPLFSYLQGLGRVKEVAKYFFFKYTIYLMAVLLSFACGFKLYALSIGNVSYIVVSLAVLIGSPLGRMLLNIARIRISARISYIKEVFPFQWRIAVSWISGYFIFQLFNPVLFATDGAEAAGQMGMTITVLTGIQALTFSWTSTKLPKYSSLVATRQFGALDSLFTRTVRQAVGVNLALLAAFALCLWTLRMSGLTFFGVDVAGRFLPMLPLILMMVPEWLNQFISAWATYLRCFKREPFLLNSVVTGVLCCLSTLGLGRMFGLWGITIGYCAITVAVTPWACYTYRHYRRRFQHEEPTAKGTTTS